jgi:signal transduction histidine kinase
VPRLIVIRGVDEGKQFELTDPVVGVGRDAANPVHLHDTEVSRRHAEFQRAADGAGYRLVDKGSANGLFVNGRPTRAADLQPGDHVQIGQTVLVYSGSRGEAPPPGDLAERIRMITRQDADLPSAIVRTIAETEGSRILARPEEVRSPWLRTRLANLRTLYDTVQAVSHILDLDQLLDRILELIFGSIEAERACVVLRDPETGALEPKAVRWRNGVRQEQIAVSNTIVEHVLGRREGVLVTDAAEDQRFRGGQSIVRLGIREAICVPMKGRHESIGVLYLDTLVPDRAVAAGSEVTKFTEDHLALAIAIAHQAALAIEATRYQQALVQSERLAAIGQTIAALSHHIKNILQGMRGGGDIVQMGLKEHDDALVRQGWKIVEKNQGKIFNLVLDMLSYSKEREPGAEPTDLNRITADVVELMRGRAKEVGADLTADLAAELPSVPADPEGIHRALLNLVGNALDAVEERPDARVRVKTAAEPDGGWIRVSVADNGTGIDPKSLGDIFKPFVSSKGARGTGLGLAVSRKILREHGGDILVQSQAGQGSTFTLRLPVRAVPLPDAGTATHAPLRPPEAD